MFFFVDKSINPLLKGHLLLYNMVNLWNFMEKLFSICFPYFSPSPIQGIEERWAHTGVPGIHGEAGGLMHIQQLMGMAPFRKKKPSDFSWDAK
jgi:hypothetical protein